MPAGLRAALRTASTGSRRRVAAGFWVAGIAAAIAFWFAAPAPAAPLLTAELEVVPPAEARLTLAPLPAGEALFCRGRQQGVDVALRLESAAGERLLEVDSPYDRRGEELLVFAPAPGSALPAAVVLAPSEKGAPPGKVALRCEGFQPDDRRLPAFAAASRAAALWAASRNDNRRAAAEEYGRASLLAEQIGEVWLAAQTRYGKAVLLRLAGDLPAAAADAAASLPVWRALGDRAFEAATLNELGLLRWRQNDFGEARLRLAEAVAIADSLDDTFTRAAAQANLCLLDLVQGAVRQGLACTEAALPAIARAKAPAIELAAWVNVGRANDVLGEPAKALAAYTRAEELYQRAGDELGLARTLNNRGVLARQLGLYQEALDDYGRALGLFERLGERQWRARVLGNLGLLYAELGEEQRAGQHLELALAAWRELGDRAGESVALAQLGRHYSISGDAAKAAANYRLALAIDRERGTRREQALSLAGLAGALAESGDPRAGLPLFGESVALLRQDGDRANLPYVRCLEGRTAGAAGEVEAAAAALAEALELARAGALPTSEVCAEKELAALLSRQGDLAGAAAHLEGALSLDEGLRRELVSPDLRASYSRIQREAHEQNVVLQMRRARAEPGGDFVARALEASERARARTFVELLGEARAGLGAGASPQKTARLAAAVRRLAAKSQRAQLAEPAEKALLAGEMLEIEREIDRLETETRRDNPRWAALERPAAPSAAAMRGLLDADTVMLVYFLAENQSFLFRVDPDTIEGFELPPRRVIEAAARRFYEELAAPGQGTAAAGAEVAELVLGPLAGRLDGRRLVVVPDGALAYLPFGALPYRSGAGGLLVDGRAVAHLPSVAALELLRAAGASPAGAEARRPIAIFADPVYDRGDPRVKAPPGAPSPAEPAEPAGPRWPRLPGSRREAEMIAALWPGAQVATDFAARRDRVLGDQLAPFRIVHFATHGSIDASRPALSGLVLSEVDPEGRPIEGMLRLGDIYGLRLGADLVVLSGCRTALGEEIRGEGLVGLARGFFHAGARRVLASLWPVEDFATATLMQAFYRALAAGQRPEQALQAAQAELRAQRRTRDPRSWASFVLLGDWR